MKILVTGAAELLQSKFMGKVKFILVGDCDKENLAVLGEEKLKAHLVTLYRMDRVSIQNVLYIYG